MATSSIGAAGAIAAGLLAASSTGALLHGRIALARATADGMTTALTHEAEHVARAMVSAVA
jgi:hypothetical protein